MVAYLLALTPEQNTLAIALLIPILGVVSPLLLAGLISRNNRKDKQQDWDRQDEVALRAEAVAEQAAKAAKLVVERQEALDQKTDEVANILKASTIDVSTELAKISLLVNSHYTEAIRSELGATEDTLAYMGELIASHQKAGIEPTMAMLSAYKGREAKISELKETLRIRQEVDEQAKLVNAGPREVVIVNPEAQPVPAVIVEPIVPEPPGG